MTATPRGRRSLRLAVLAVAGVALLSPMACKQRSRIRRTGDAAAVVVVPHDPSRAGELPAAAEREPNDNPARPELLALSGAPLAAAVSGTLPVAGKKRDVDLFRVDVPVGAAGAAPALADGGGAGARRLGFELRAEGASAVLAQLVDGRGQVVATVTAAPGARAAVPNVSALPGSTYVARVRSAAEPSRDTGAVAPGYRLTVRIDDFEIGEEREPNASAATANVLERAESGAEVTGFLAARRDEDWYRVSFEGLGALAAVSAEVDPLEGVAVTVSVHDAAGGRLGGVRGRREQRAAVEGIAVPAGSGHFCFVVVRAEAGHNLEQRYHLRVRAEVREETPPAAAGTP